MFPLLKLAVQIKFKFKGFINKSYLSFLVTWRRFKHSNSNIISWTFYIRQISNIFDISYSGITTGGWETRGNEEKEKQNEKEEEDRNDGLDFST